MEKETDAKEKRKKILQMIAGMLAFAISYFAVQQIFFKTPSFDKLLTEAASEVNKKAPMMVDEVTRLDNAVALPDNIFQYNYTIVNMTKEEVSLDTLKKYLEPNIINNVKTNPDLKVFRDNKVTMNYYYKDKNGKFIHRISVTPELYMNE